MAVPEGYPKAGQMAKFQVPSDTKPGPISQKSSSAISFK